MISYILFAIPAALVIWMIGIVRRPRPNQMQSPPDVTRDHGAPRGANRFISDRALQNQQRRRELAALATAQAPELGVPAASRRTRASRQAEIRARDNLKTACLALLDAAAIEHPAGHTGSVARYVLRSNDGGRIELMFEKGAKSRARLWLTREQAGDLLSAGIEFRLYPAADLYKPTEAGGEPSYGRHAALKMMRDLANADLVRFTVYRVEQVQRILAKVAKDDLPAPSPPDSRRAEMARGASPGQGVRCRKAERPLSDSLLSGLVANKHGKTHGLGDLGQSPAQTALWRPDGHAPELGNGINLGSVTWPLQTKIRTE